MYTKKTKEMKHITPITVTLDSKTDLSVESSTSCERPCVCVCVCKHGGSKALDFENNDINNEKKQLYDEFINGQ
jgi:hypothetical protein